VSGAGRKMEEQKERGRKRKGRGRGRGREEEEGREMGLGTSFESNLERTLIFVSYTLYKHILEMERKIIK
jgi:hypothetical protein